jgi:ankyrin repeat protein
MRLLLKHGANPEILALEEGPLHHASYCRRADDIQLLLQRKIYVDTEDSKLRSPLHCASLAVVGHVNVVQCGQLPLEHGAKVNALSKTHYIIPCT